LIRPKYRVHVRINAVKEKFVEDLSSNIGKRYFAVIIRVFKVAFLGMGKMDAVVQALGILLLISASLQNLRGSSRRFSNFHTE
jgi:hypothetical protein